MCIIKKTEIIVLVIKDLHYIVQNILYVHFEGERVIEGILYTNKQTARILRVFLRANPILHTDLCPQLHMWTECTTAKKQYQQ